jgi:hypothetical protein
MENTKLFSERVLFFCFCAGMGEWVVEDFDKEWAFLKKGI